LSVERVHAAGRGEGGGATGQARGEGAGERGVLLPAEGVRPRDPVFRGPAAGVPGHVGGAEGALAAGRDLRPDRVRGRGGGGEAAVAGGVPEHGGSAAGAGDLARQGPVRIGILGGTFDPPHIGHLIVAQDAWNALGLDRVLFVPAAVPPHKRGRVSTPAEVRLAMVEAACADDPRFEASDLEIRRGGTSYTVDTLRALKERDPQGALFFLLGADQFREIHTWRSPEELVRLAELVALSRPGYPNVEPQIGLPYRRLDVTCVDISATEIRRRVVAGEPIRYLVPEAVEAIIRAHGL